MEALLPPPVEPRVSGPAVRCIGLHKRYGDVVAVDGVDLHVEAGECFGLLGPNGAGKTTTVEILEGLIEADGGEVEVLGRRWDRDPSGLRQRIGIQLQETRLAEKLSVSETIRLFRSFYREGPSVDGLLSLVQLRDKRDAWVGRLSSGQRQRLAVACALAGSPELLFLDEPTTGLDPQSRRSLWELVERYRDSGRTVVLTTHYMEEAARLCDRVAIMDGGRIIATGAPAELVASLEAGHTVEFSLANGAAGPDEAALGRLPGVASVRREGGRFVLSTREVHRLVPALLAELERSRTTLGALSTSHATLEDVFVSLTGKRLRDE